jgi:hypothetical protein
MCVMMTAIELSHLRVGAGTGSCYTIKQRPKAREIVSLKQPFSQNSSFGEVRE